MTCLKVVIIISSGKYSLIYIFSEKRGDVVRTMNFLKNIKKLQKFLCCGKEIVHFFLWGGRGCWIRMNSFLTGKKNQLQKFMRFEGKGNLEIVKFWFSYEIPEKSVLCSPLDNFPKFYAVMKQYLLQNFVMTCLPLPIRWNALKKIPTFDHLRRLFEPWLGNRMSFV